MKLRRFYLWGMQQDTAKQRRWHFLQDKSDGKIIRERTSVSFLTSVTNLYKDRHIYELIGKTRDRDEWRKVVSSDAATFEPGIPLGDADHRRMSDWKPMC